jgi:hypothetical protein
MKNENKILMVLFLFAILPLTVYFSQQKQTVSQHAQDLSPVTPTPIRLIKYMSPTPSYTKSASLSPTLEPTVYQTRIRAIPTIK